MSSPGLGMSGTPQASLTNLVEQKLRAERVVKAGANWFVTVAVLSILKSVLSMSGTGIRFIFGLGFAQLIDALAHQAGQSGVALDLVINGLIAGVFVVFWNLAKRGQHWAFLVGMGLYAADALIMLYFKDILALAFHGYALYRMYSGMTGIASLRTIEQRMMPAGAPIEPR